MAPQRPSTQTLKQPQASSFEIPNPKTLKPLNSLKLLSPEALNSQARARTQTEEAIAVSGDGDPWSLHGEGGGLDSGLKTQGLGLSGFGF